MEICTFIRLTRRSCEKCNYIGSLAGIEPAALSLDLAAG